MKKLFAILTAATALATAMPAAAQWNNNYGNAEGIRSRIAQLDARLQAGINARVISRAEEQRLRWQINELWGLHRQYSYNGLSRTERMDLSQRIRNVRSEIRLADNNRFDRDYRYGEWNDRYWNEGRYTGQGGPYEEAFACDQRSGISGVIDRALGRDHCFEVGQRVSGSLYDVPYQYRDRYRDGRDVYYRSDGRAIYAIDARTDTVIRVHRM
jgi:hypothetical protein